MGCHPSNTQLYILPLILYLYSLVHQPRDQVIELHFCFAATSKSMSLHDFHIPKTHPSKSHESMGNSGSSNGGSLVPYLRLMFQAYVQGDIPTKHGQEIRYFAVPPSIYWIRARSPKAITFHRYSKEYTM